MSGFLTAGTMGLNEKFNVIASIREDKKMFKGYQEEVIKLCRAGKNVGDALKAAYDNEKVKVGGSKVNALQYRYFAPVALRCVVGKWRVDYPIAAILDQSASLDKKQCFEYVYAFKVAKKIREDLDTLLSERAGTRVEVKSFLFDF